MKINLQQLSEQCDVSIRTIRFYIQKGLLKAPYGERKGAYYTEEHLAELLRIRSWQEAGLSLDAIQDLLAAKTESPVMPVRTGMLEVRSHLIIADGIELVIAPDRAHLTQDQIRELFNLIQNTCDDMAKNNKK